MYTKVVYIALMYIDVHGVQICTCRQHYSVGQLITYI